VVVVVVVGVAVAPVVGEVLTRREAVPLAGGARVTPLPPAEARVRAAEVAEAAEVAAAVAAAARSQLGLPIATM
jgi:hypothetical protein